jgi:hypothetical protein
MAVRSMPIHEEISYWAECDECDWSSEDTPERSQAEYYLDEHIREEH